MSLSIKDIKNKARQIVEKSGVDMTKPGSGAGSVLAAKGLARLRLTGYIEVGSRKKVYKGQEKTKPQVWLEFELSGKKHPPVEFDGGSRPQRLIVKETLSNTSKANLIKLFKMMNYEGDATHMSELIGQPFIGTIHHIEVGQGDDKKIIATLRGDTGYDIRKPEKEDEESGEMKAIAVGPMVGEPRVFFWDFPDEDQWNSLFVSENYNPYQEGVKEAVNFKGSAAEALLSDLGLDLADADDDDADADADDDDDDAPEPSKPAKKNSKPAPQPEPDDDDDDDDDSGSDDDDPEPEPVKPQKKASTKKPAATKQSKPNKLDDDDDPLAGIA